MSEHILNEGLPDEAKPKLGDSEEMLLIRTLLGNDHKLAAIARDLQERLSVVESQTAECFGTKVEVDKLVMVLAPEGAPQRHIDVRVNALEVASASARGKGWAVLQALLVTGLIGLFGWGAATASAVSDIAHKVKRIEARK